MNDPYDFFGKLLTLEPGDGVIAKKDIISDGTYPGLKRGDLIVKKGTKGCVVRFFAYFPPLDDDLFEVTFPEEKRVVICPSKELKKEE